MKRALICYTNHRGETEMRVIEPHRIWYGSTEHHKEQGWLLDAFDYLKIAERTFALKGIHFWKNVDISPDPK